MSSEKKIKIQAKNALKGNMAAAMGAFIFSATAVLMLVFITDLLFSLTDFLLFTVSGNIADGMRSSLKVSRFTVEPVIICVSLVFLSPVFLGVLRHCYKLAKNEDVDFNEIFRYTGKNYSRGLHICVAIILRSFWRILLPLAPGFISIAVSVTTTAGKQSLAIYDTMWYLISYALIFFGIMGAAALSHKYFLSVFIFFEDENSEIEDILKCAAEYIVPYNQSTFRLTVKLSPYILSCFLIIPAIFVIPYILTCYSISAKWIIKSNLKCKEV